MEQAPPPAAAAEAAAAAAAEGEGDEELEQLLGEIPRATSAPPHLEELQRAYGAIPDDSPFVLVREDEVAVKPFADIRQDESYEDFYRTYQGIKKLPPPVEALPLFTDSPYDSPKAGGGGAAAALHHHHHHGHHFAPFFVDTGGGENGEDEQQHRQPPSGQPQRQHPPPPLPLPQEQPGRQQQRREDLSSAFQKLGFTEAAPSPRAKGAGGSGGGGRGGANGAGGLGGSSGGLARSASLDRSAGGSGGGSGYQSDGNVGGGTSTVRDHLFAPMPMYRLPVTTGTGLEGHLGRTASGGLDLFTKRPLPGVDTLVGGGGGGGVFGGLGGLRGSPDEDVAGSRGAQSLDQLLLRRSNSALELYSGRSNGGSVAEDLGGGPTANLMALPAVAPPGGRAGGGLSQGLGPGGGDFYAGAGGQASPLDFDVTAYLQVQQQQLQQRAQQVAALQLQAQRLQAAQLAMEEERVRHRQQQALLQAQQQQLRMLYGCIPNQASSYLSGAPAGQQHVGSAFKPPALDLPRPGQGGHERSRSPTLRQPEWMGGTSTSDPAAGRICKYFAQQGFCSRGNMCPYVHAPPASTRVDQQQQQRQKASGSGKDGSRRPPHQPGAERYSSRRGGAPSSLSLQPSDCNERRQQHRKGGGSDGAANGDGRAHGGDLHGMGTGGSFDADDFERVHGLPPGTSLQAKYASLDEVEGRIYAIAKDQHGCRFLQKQFDEGGLEDVSRIYGEIRGHLQELMVDPFGNYLVQKLLEVCTDTQRLDILMRVTPHNVLISISLNLHGTRAVQKLIETLRGPKQVGMVIAALQPGVVALIKDLNGNHVIQRCLQRLSPDDSQFIFDAAAANCVEIATHRHGCCVLQRCIDFALGPQRQRLVAEIAANALVLSQDPFGNYVVQYTLDLNLPWVASDVMARLEGNYPYLSQQKFSSNVVEKCLKLAAGDEARGRIVRELTQSPRLGQLLQDPYANYVVQSALTLSKGSLHAALVEAIRPHIPALRSSPYGKRILSRTNLKQK